MIREVKLAGKLLKLELRNEGDVAIANELFLDRQYRQCDDVIRKAARCVMDIGGHLGFFSLMAATLNSKVPIYTFEPHAGNFELLKTNLKNNRIKNVFPKQLAVSDEVGETELQISREDLNHSLVKAIEPTGQTQKIQTTTLERIFEKNRIVKCDLLKLDCEGSEFKIIYGASNELFKKIDHIFLEYHDWACPPKLERRGAGHSSELKKYLQKLGYRVEQYKELIERAKAKIPGVAITTDIIVGFPGETEEDFEQTLSLLEEVRYHSAYSFAYSERVGTRALRIEPSVPVELRFQRLRTLQALQDRITHEWLQSMVGQTEEVLIEGPSRTEPGRSTGRTGTNRLVHVDGAHPIGAFLTVRISEAFKHSLLGTPI